MTRRNALAAFALFAAALYCYSLTFTGTLTSGDNQAQYLQPRQLLKGRVTFSADDHRQALVNDQWGLHTRFFLNHDGKTYSQMYGISQSVMALPLFVCLKTAKRLAGLPRPADTTLWAASWPVFTALSVLFIAAWLRRQGLNAAAASALVFAAAFASPLWMHSNMPYNVVGETMLICASIWLCLRPPTRGTAVALGLLLGIGVATRPFFAVSLPAFVVWFAFGRKHLPWLLGSLTAVLAVIVGSHAHYFGSPLSTGYTHLGGGLHFNESWTRRISDIFLNSTKSPLYYFPLGLLLVPAFLLVLKRSLPVALFIFLFCLPQFWLMPKISFWENGPDLFVRYWLRVIPIAILACSTAWAAPAPRTQTRRAGAFVFIALAVLGLRASILTVLTDERGVHEQALETMRTAAPLANPSEYHESFFDVLLGQNIVSRYQMDALSQPRQYILFSEQPYAAARAALLVPGMLAFIGSCVLFFRAPSGSRNA